MHQLVGRDEEIKEATDIWLGIHAVCLRVQEAMKFDFQPGSKVHYELVSYVAENVKCESSNNEN